MKFGDAACRLVGQPRKHGEIFQRVADRVQSVIISRAVGAACHGLIEEGQAMKGFRVDTKSCDWGPMQGLVCADPRLNKDGMHKAEFNFKMTAAALAGHLEEFLKGGFRDDFGTATEQGTYLDAIKDEWRADLVPIAISAKRFAYLQAEKQIEVTGDVDIGGMRCITGTSTHTTTDPKDAKKKLGTWTVRFDWVLIPLKMHQMNHAGVTQYFLGSRVLDGEYFAIGVRKISSTLDVPDQTDIWQINKDTGGALSQHTQLLPEASIDKRVEYLGHDILMGLANPGTKKMGFRAAVVGDYDLFSVWPLASDQKLQAPVGMSPGARAVHDASGRYDYDARPLRLAGDTAKAREGYWNKPPPVSALITMRERLKPVRRPEREKLGATNDPSQTQSTSTRISSGEHFQMGSISRRLNMIKVLLNSELQSEKCAGYTGGQLVHHSDEVGNPIPHLAKELHQCMPLIAFVPKIGIFGVETLTDFISFVWMSRGLGYTTMLKDKWCKEYPSLEELLPHGN